MKKILTALALVASPTVMAADVGSTANADNAAGAFVMINSAAAMTQGAALVLANNMLDQGAKVDIMLCDEAGNLALKGAQAPKLKGADASPIDLLNGAMSKEAEVAVCALYLPNTGHTAEDLLEGVLPAKPPVMAEKMLNNKTFVF